VSTVHYCWVCEIPLISYAVWSDTHYESGRRIYFCSLEHLREHRVLK
jgi:hypothetical protein